MDMLGAMERKNDPARLFDEVKELKGVSAKMQD